MSSSPPALVFTAEQQQQLELEIQRRVHMIVAQQQAAAAPPPVVAPRITPMKPERFDGSDLNKTLTFLEAVKLYLELAGISALAGPEVVKHAQQFLSGAAMAWFASVQSSPDRIVDWATFESRLKGKYLPYGYEKTARTELSQTHLSQFNRDLQAFHAKFDNILMHIDDMNPKDQIHTYLNAIKSYDKLHERVFTKFYDNPNWTLKDVMDYATATEKLLQHSRMFQPHAQRSFPSGMRTGGYERSFSRAAPSSSSAPMDLSNVESQSKYPVPQFHAEPTESSSQSLAAMSFRPRPQAGASRPHGAGALLKLTPEERDRCFREGLCLRCRQPGHNAVNCPKNPKNGSAQ
jgi:hypothetical protein